MKVIKKHWKKIVLILFLVLFLLYCILVNILVSAALVPSFMRRLDAFQEITEESVDQLVHSDTIVENTKQMVSDTYDWLETVTIQEKEITSKDGYTLVAAQILQQETSHKWVITLHGYTGCKEEQYPMAMEFYEKGYNVLGPDLRCQGSSEGDFIGMGWTDREDVLQWIQLILQEDPQAQIVLYGQSMGAACALMVSGMEGLPDNVVAVISDCAYTTAYAMFQKQAKDWFHLPAFPLVDSCNLALQLRGGYDLKDASALDAVKESKVPTLFIHGTEDAMVPSSMCQELYDACNADKKDILLVDGAGHAQSMYADPDLYFQTMWDFLGES